ncbi:unnamed protein product [Caenorhabditis bovis]|uniref:Uncharacterized protein n=1 Tax=Caenorhabditis bovis TaxID=2654633 RepID=A0A8S1EB94_9PELO|nr:unnamed protein product [Caenorhabditis bovis]
MWLSTVFFLIVTFIIIYFSYCLSKSKTGQQLNPIPFFEPDVVYTPLDIRNLLANKCKLPYIFLGNEDVERGIPFRLRSTCRSRFDDVVQLNENGIIQMMPGQSKYLRPFNISCYYQEIFDVEMNRPLMNHLGEAHLIDVRNNSNTIVQFQNFAVSCTKRGEVVYFKPFINFPPKGEASPSKKSIAILLLPNLHHKLFMKTMTKSKKLIANNQFSIFKAAFQNEPMMNDNWKAHFGLNKGLNLLKIAKEHNFETFLSGVDEIRRQLKHDFTRDSSVYKNFVKQFYTADDTEETCRHDGKAMIEDDIEIFERYVTSVKQSDSLSLFFVDASILQLYSIDNALYWALQKLNDKKVFQHTDVVIMSYNNSEGENVDQDAANNFLAIRLSDERISNFPESRNKLEINSNRLISNMHVNALLANLITENIGDSIKFSPIQTLLSANSVCSDVDIDSKHCFCTEILPSSQYSENATSEFLEHVEDALTREIQSTPCVKLLNIDKTPTFFRFSDPKKGDFEAVELIAHIERSTDMMKFDVRKTFKYYKFFEGFHEYDAARAIMPDGTNIAINGYSEIACLFLVKILIFQLMRLMTKKKDWMLYGYFITDQQKSH